MTGVQTCAFRSVCTCVCVCVCVCVRAHSRKKWCLNKKGGGGRGAYVACVSIQILYKVLFTLPSLFTLYSLLTYLTLHAILAYLPACILTCRRRCCFARRRRRRCYFARRRRRLPEYLHSNQKINDCSSRRVASRRVLKRLPPFVSNAPRGGVGWR